MPQITQQYIVKKTRKMHPV